MQNCGAWDNCIEANPQAQKRMIVRDGKIIDLPDSLSSFLSSPFLSLRGKFRIIGELFIPRAKRPDYENVASFISRRLGKEALDYAANPFLAGIYAAKPESLSLNQAFPKLLEIEKKYRSLFLGLRKIRKSKDNPNLKKTRLVSFSNGMQELINNLSSTLEKQILQITIMKPLSKNLTP